jgi:hypothetical protein
MLYEKAPSSGAFLPLSLMYFLSGDPMHDLSGVDSSDHNVRDFHSSTSAAPPNQAATFESQMIHMISVLSG